MLEAPSPPNETQRLTTLRGLGILDTPAEERFDRITRTAMRLFDVPIALISLVDANRQWSKSCQGLSVSETPRGISFCAHAILGTDVLLIPDALADPRFADNPLVIGDPYIRFYAGCPLTATDGSRLGTLCISDRRPRQMSDADLHALRDLATWAENELSLIQSLQQELAVQRQKEVRNRTARKRAEEALHKAEAKHRTLLEQIPAVTYTAEFGAAGAWHYVSPQIEPLLGFSPAEWLADPERWHKQLHPDDRERVLAAEVRSRDRGEPFGCEYRLRTRDGRVVWIRDEAVVMVDAAGQPLFLQGFLLDITERKWAEEALRRQNAYLAALHETTLALMNRLDLADLLETIVSWAGQLLGTPHGYIYLVEPGETQLEFKVGVGSFSRHIGYRLKLGDGLAGKVWQTGQPLVVSDYNSWPGHASEFSYDTFCAVMGVPLTSGAQVVGVIGMAHIGPDRTFGDDEVELLSRFAQLASIALDNARLYTSAQQELGERKQTEHALRESEQRYRELYAAAQRQAQDLALLGQVRTALARKLDLPTIFRSVVEAIVEAFGYTQVSLYLLEGQELVLQHQVGYDRVIVRIPIAQGISGRVIRTGQPILLEDVRADPTFLGAIDGIVSEICVPLFDQGQVVGILNVESTSGITLSEVDLQLMIALSEQISIAIGRARLYTEARESEAKNRALLNAIPDMMFRMNRDGVYLDFKAEKEIDLVVPPSAFLGKTASDVLPPDLAQQSLHYIERALQTGDTQIFEYQLPINSALRDYEARIVVSGRDEIIAIVRDITERKKVDRMKSEFISTVSHELRTPLTSIRGSLGLINGGVAGELPARVKTMIDIAYKNSERLVRLINDILDIEKIESGKMDFVLKPLALAPLLEQAIEANRAYGEQFGVTFRLEPVRPDIKVNADGDRLTQVITNLLSNAAKFSPPNDAVVISVSPSDERIRVAITDHGPGIPEEFHARMFQKFAQADSSDTRQKGGTGLGLSISKAIIEKLGGRIGFETARNAGTTFYFDLPEWREALARIRVTSNSEIERRLRR